MPRQPAKPSSDTETASNERTGVDRLYKRYGKRKVSFWYKYPDGRSETFATTVRGDRQGTANAERIAKRKALDIQAGEIIAGSVADMIDRFRDDIDPTQYRDQSPENKSVRKGAYERLTLFCGRMSPAKLETTHGTSFWMTAREPVRRSTRTRTWR